MTPTFNDAWRLYWSAWEVCALAAIEMPGALMREVTRSSDSNN